MREELSRYQDAHPCDACGGYRLKPQALAVKIGAQAYRARSTDMSIKCRPTIWFAELPKTLSEEAERDRHAHPQGDPGAAAVPGRCRARLSHTVARGSGTLSGGESQRIRLASQIGSGLTGVLYVLDEPSIGLHQRDNARLLVKRSSICATSATR